MKKYRYHILLTVLLFLVSLVLFLNDKPGTLKIGTDAFSIRDTAGITSIQFAKGNERLLLQKSGDDWLVNKSFHAKPHAVKVLIRVLMNLEIQSPVAKSMKFQAVRSFSANTLKVTVLSGEQILKSFQIAENDSLKIGSLVMLQGDDEPYVLKLAGFEGHLSEVFPVDSKFWRDNNIFHYGPADIKSVEINYPDDRNASFIYYFQDFKNLLIKSPDDKRTINIDKESARNFLMNFRSVSYVQQVNENSRKIFDSLSRQRPLCEISLVTTAGQQLNVKTYRIPDRENLSFDENRMYAVIQNDTTPVIVKYIDFDPIMKQFSDFAAR